MFGLGLLAGVGAVALLAGASVLPSVCPPESTLRFVQGHWACSPQRDVVPACVDGGFLTSGDGGFRCQDTAPKAVVLAVAPPKCDGGVAVGVTSSGAAVCVDVVSTLPACAPGEVLQMRDAGWACACTGMPLGDAGECW